VRNLDQPLFLHLGNGRAEVIHLIDTKVAGKVFELSVRIRLVLKVVEQSGAIAELWGP
jgi:hypothetical protein